MEGECGVSKVGMEREGGIECLMNRIIKEETEKEDKKKGGIE